MVGVRLSRNAEELRHSRIEWVRNYDERRLIERRDHRAPSVVRRELVALDVFA